MYSIEQCNLQIHVYSKVVFISTVSHPHRRHPVSASK